jgi:superfamily I DNA/RNA helicase
MTFSRRAAVEMTRRVQRIGNEAFGPNRAVAGGALTGALSWAGTFHAIGARLLREYAHQIGLEPTFTIHDREDSADLMNLVRHDLGLSAHGTRRRPIRRGARAAARREATPLPAIRERGCGRDHRAQAGQRAAQDHNRGLNGFHRRGVTASGVPLPELTKPAAVSLNGL